MNNMLIGLYDFDGPGAGLDLREEAGIYAVLHSEHGRFQLVDLHQSANMKYDWELRKRRYQAKKYPGTLSIATYYMDGLSAGERQRVVNEIMQELDMIEDLAS